jgi:hypothetical protein
MRAVLSFKMFTVNMDHINKASLFVCADAQTQILLLFM